MRNAKTVLQTEITIHKVYYLGGNHYFKYERNLNNRKIKAEKITSREYSLLREHSPINPKPESTTEMCTFILERKINSDTWKDNILSCSVSCSPSHLRIGGKCHLNDCFHG